MPIGRLSSFTSHRCWKMYSVRNRVFVKMSVVLFALIRS